MHKESVKIRGLALGMASTYGNFIRRCVMLNNVGWDLAAVRIQGGSVKTYFDIIDGIGEDSCELITKLQQIKVYQNNLDLNLDKDNVRRVDISLTGENLRVKHIEDQLEGFTVVAKDQTIANAVVGQNKSLELQLIYLKSKGSKSRQENEIALKDLASKSEELKTISLDNFIYMNSVYRCIDKVYFTYENNGDNTETLDLFVESEMDNYVDIVKSQIKSECKIVEAVCNSLGSR